MKKKNVFKYLIIIGVLIIPFMYSFFYLKAYWNPYGKGNIDNLDVVVVNSDKGSKGEMLINSIKSSKKLKISVLSEKKAEDGLYNGKYYAIIKIPEDFTSSMKSASTNNKRHATITYSPNQKTNYLSSQIINTVILNVEKSLDNTVNSEIVKGLSEKLESVPEQLDTVTDGFSELKDGTSKIRDGSTKLYNGTNTLNDNYNKFNEGVKSVKDGTETLNNATGQLSNLGSGLNELIGGVNTLTVNNNQLNISLSNYINLINGIMTISKNRDIACQNSSQYCSVYNNILTQSIDDIIANYKPNVNLISDSVYYIASQLKNIGYGSCDLVSATEDLGNKILNGSNQINTGINTLNSKVSSLNGVDKKISDLQSGINTLNIGANKLYESSLQLKDGIGNLNVGTSTLNNGIVTLDNSVLDAKNTLSNKVDNTKKDLEKVESLKDYSKEPVKVKTKEINKVSSYGTAFAPLFISIALWVGCLMIYIVIYYDKEKRFGILGIDSKKRVKRTLIYHGLATVMGIVLGILLQILLDFEFTNILLYYLILILISNCFLSIIQFFIGNFGDVGKFISLIVLVLQLAASGGTFPIETVTKGFRFLNPILPMTYTIRLIKESLVTIENSLLIKNALIVFVIFVVFFIINIVLDIYKQNKD